LHTKEKLPGSNTSRWYSCNFVPDFPTIFSQQQVGFQFREEFSFVARWKTHDPANIFYADYFLRSMIWTPIPGISWRDLHPKQLQPTLSDAHGT
jgi:hypothetical protein